MKTLTTITAVGIAALLIAVEQANIAAERPVDGLASWFDSAEIYFNLPKGLVSAVCYVETAHIPTAVHRHDGLGDSLGICQMKLATARLMGFKGTKAQLMNPRTNILYASAYLKHQVRRYNGDYAKAVTAFNQGTCYSHGGSAYLAKVFTRWSEAK